MARAGIASALLLPLMLGLAACGPVPVEQAELTCLRDAEMAQRPRGEVALGVGSGGRGGTSGYGSISLEMTSDYVMGRDPSEVYNRCVVNRSGQMPRRVLAEQPGWRG